MRARRGAPRCRSLEVEDEGSPIVRKRMRGGLERLFSFLSPKHRIGGRVGHGLELLLVSNQSSR